MLPQKAILWKNKRSLILADLHLGKVAHFRKAGIPVPSTLAVTDYQVLDYLLNTYLPERVIFLGDLFHSSHNLACDTFVTWRQRYAQLLFTLVKGNHDLLSDAFYANAGIEIYPEILSLAPFVFSHIPLTQEPQLYNLSGHLHPVVKLVGRAKQTILLPCYYFGKKGGIVPAFGNFTGKGSVMPSTDEKSQIFVISFDQVIPVTRQ